MIERTNLPKPDRHLLELQANKIPQITVSVNKSTDLIFEYNIDDESANVASSFMNNAEEINFYEPAYSLERGKHLNAGSYSYVISAIDSQSKFSNKYKNCTGLLVAGVDKRTGKNVSFLTHQEPVNVILLKKEKFLDHLRLQLERVKAQCKPGTLDSILIGGNDLNQNHTFLDDNLDPVTMSYAKIYTDSNKLISDEVKKILGFEPDIVNGPKTVTGGDEFYYDNENRRGYLARPKITQIDNPKDANEPLRADMKPSDLDKYKGRWK
jgi:hypothetical protein